MKEQLLKITQGNVKFAVWAVAILFAVYFSIWNPITDNQRDVAIIQEQISKITNNDLQHIDQRLRSIEEQQLKIIENQGKILGALSIKNYVP